MSLLRRADNAIDAALHSKLSKGNGLIWNGTRYTDKLNLMLIHTGEDRDGGKLGTVADNGLGILCALAAGPHHLLRATPVNRNEIGTGERSALDSTSNLMRDIVELGVHEHAKTTPFESHNNGWSLIVNEGDANLHPTGVTLEKTRDSQRLIRAAVECHHNPVTRVDVSHCASSNCRDLFNLGQGIPEKFYHSLVSPSLLEK